MSDHSTLRLLRPEEVIQRWPDLSRLLDAAVREGKGEVEVEDLLSLVLSGRMFIFATDAFALTCEFVVYPRKTVMIVGFGSGQVGNHRQVLATMETFARQGGASSIQTYCRNPAMVRYYKRFFEIEPLYAVLEREL